MAQAQVIKPEVNLLLLSIHGGIAGFVIWIMFSGASVPLAFYGGAGILILINFIIWVVLSAICTFFLVQNFKNTEYTFYPDRVEYFEGFLAKNRKSVQYSKITNVSQRKGVIENWFGLGTIYLDTAGSSSKGHELSMRYLKNPDAIYNWVNQVVSRK